MKALSREGRLYVIETMLMRLKYEGSQVEWEQYEYNKKKKYAFIRTQEKPI